MPAPRPPSGASSRHGLAVPAALGMRLESESFDELAGGHAHSLPYHVVVADPSGAISTDPFAGDLSATDDESIPTRLLVMGMAHRDGSILGDELYSVVEPCGLTVDQVRSQLRRLVNEGLFTRDGEGKDARYRATAEGTATLTSTLRRHNLAYAQDAAGRGWDRKWRIVAFADPRVARAPIATSSAIACSASAPRRSRTACTCRRIGGTRRCARSSIASTSPSTSRSPPPTTSRSAATTTRATSPRRCGRSTTSPPATASSSRPTATCPSNLEAMNRRGERLREVDFLPGALHIAIRFNQCFESDPLLPPELLPRPWPGREAPRPAGPVPSTGSAGPRGQAGPGPVPGVRRGHPQPP